MSLENFDDTLLLHLYRRDKERLQDIVNENPDDYESVSHAVRCAIQAFIRQRGKL